MRLPRLRRSEPVDESAEWMAMAAGYAARLTETGSRCHLNDGTTRFCHWQAQELPRKDAAGRSLVVGQRDLATEAGFPNLTHDLVEA